MQPLPPDEFEALVQAALGDLPAEFPLDNVAVLVEDENPEDPELLGLYEGIPMTERYDYAGVEPDRISVYRIPLCLMAADADELVTEIKITVVHEVAHYLGIEEERLHELGWG